MIKVLIVDDSKLVALAIQELLSADSEISVAGIARDGIQAVEMTKKLKPDLITMDIHMPGVDGFEATKRIMGECPTPILVVSASVFKDGMDKVFRALSFGALDVIDKSAIESFQANGKAKKEVIEKVKMLSGIRVITHPLSGMESRMGGLNADPSRKVQKRKIVGIVSSTGGTEALRMILKALPKEFPCPIVVVQHISPGFVQGFSEWLDREIHLNVKVAEQGESLVPGCVYIAPSELHMKIAKTGRVFLEGREPVLFQRPSGNLLLHSIAASYGFESLGVVLTGMGADGAEGLRAIYEAKGYTIAQDENSSVVFGMPKSAIELGAARAVLPLSSIAEALMKETVG